jgi:hypothetical protein
MTIPEILIWEATNVLLLIPVVIVLVMLTRWIRRRPFHRPGLIVFDWPSTGESSFASPMAQIRGALVRCYVIGFEGYVLLPFGLASFIGAVFLTALVV